MKRSASIPRVTSKTITVRSLLRKIQRVILDEPKRLNMNDCVISFKGQRVTQYSPEHPMPACGTVACMAGWGAVLLRPDGGPAEQLSMYAVTVMDDLLGYEERYGYKTVGDLFSCDISDLDVMEDQDAWTLPPAGTPAHADAVSARIDNYMARHPEILSRKIDVKAARLALRA